MNLRFKIYPKAVFTGVLTGLILGLLIGPLEMALIFGTSLSGTALHIISLVFGALVTLLGAYLTASKAPTDKLANVLAFWVINELLGVLSLFVLAFPIWYNLVGAISVFAASLLGWQLESLTHDRI